MVLKALLFPEEGGLDGVSPEPSKIEPLERLVRNRTAHLHYHKSLYNVTGTQRSLQSFHEEASRPPFKTVLLCAPNFRRTTTMVSIRKIFVALTVATFAVLATAIPAIGAESSVGNVAGSGEGLLDDAFMLPTSARWRKPKFLRVCGRSHSSSFCEGVADQLYGKQVKKETLPLLVKPTAV